jgi:hypothetical protein
VIQVGRRSAAGRRIGARRRPERVLPVAIQLARLCPRQLTSPTAFDRPLRRPTLKRHFRRPATVHCQLEFTHNMRILWPYSTHGKGLPAALRLRPTGSANPVQNPPSLSSPSDAFDGRSSQQPTRGLATAANPLPILWSWPFRPKESSFDDMMSAPRPSHGAKAETQ